LEFWNKESVRHRGSVSRPSPRKKGGRSEEYRLLKKGWTVLDAFEQGESFVPVTGLWEKIKRKIMKKRLILLFNRHFRFL